MPAIVAEFTGESPMQCKRVVVSLTLSSLLAISAMRMPFAGAQETPPTGKKGSEKKADSSAKNGDKGSPKESSRQ